MTLRLRPDRIILGKLRGVKAVAFLEAINTCHEGRFTTLHAPTARKAVNRLAFLMMRAGMPLTPTEIRDYVREAIDVIVQTRPRPPPPPALQRPRDRCPTMRRSRGPGGRPA